MRVLILLMVLAVCSAAEFSLNSYRDTKETTIDCNLDINGYCGDCFTQRICLKDGAGESNVPCNSGHVCAESGGFATCVDPSNVPDCQCPGTGIAQTADAYDNQKFITWVDCDGTVSTCPGGQYVNHYTGECETSLPTEFPITPSPEPCPADGEYDVVWISCTRYRICYGNGETSEVLDCASGKYFDTDINDCVAYLPFSCPDEAGASYYPDPHDCTKFYLCSDGSQVGDVSYCTEGQVFDESVGGCIEGGVCNEVEDCGICPDGVQIFPIDCQRYYQCTQTPEGSDLDFTPVLKSCPEGFYYDEVTGYCTADVEGCP